MKNWTFIFFARHWREDSKNIGKDRKRNRKLFKLIECVKYYWFVFCLLYSAFVYSQCDYPVSVSAQGKPIWLKTELPPSGNFYYYDKGYGIGKTYEEALDNAIVNIGKKRNLATGQMISFDTNNTAVYGTLTVKARIEHEYWEYCLDPDSHNYLYYLHILCVIVNNPSKSIDEVKTDKKFLKP
jgi:hypothetical protein